MTILARCAARLRQPLVFQGPFPDARGSADGWRSHLGGRHRGWVLGGTGGRRRHGNRGFKTSGFVPLQQVIPSLFADNPVGTNCNAFLILENRLQCEGTKYSIDREFRRRRQADIRSPLQLLNTSASIVLVRSTGNQTSAPVFRFRGGGEEIGQWSAEGKQRHERFQPSHLVRGDSARISVPSFRFSIPSISRPKGPGLMSLATGLFSHQMIRLVLQRSKSSIWAT